MHDLIDPLVRRRTAALAAPVAPAALLVDKPLGATSFDVVRTVRRLTETRKVGHAGTLDPMATGLLVVLVGRGATRHQRHFMALRKVYEGTLRLGEVTPSYDAETDVSEWRDPSGVSDAVLAEARDAFVGTVVQKPPMYSAVKVDGERLYRKARRGETAARPPRQVVVYTFEITDRRGPDVDFRVACSKGTYIRSLAHDLGQELGVGAHLTRLRRTTIGPYQVDDAWTPDGLAEVLCDAGDAAGPPASRGSHPREP